MVKLALIGTAGLNFLKIVDVSGVSPIDSAPSIIPIPPMDEYPQQTASRNPFSKGPTKRSKGSDKKVRW